MTFAVTRRDHDRAEGMLRIAAPKMLPAHDARALTGPDGTARIDLDGQSYILRITRAGKLILTK